MTDEDETYRTRTGKVLTDADIEALADEAERGYDIEGLKARQRGQAMPKVVHCKREPYDVYIGRPSKWGNPFEIGRHGTRDEVIAKYREWLLSGDLVHEVTELRGKTLGCWCAPNACHGDVLVELANA